MPLARKMRTVLLTVALAIPISAHADTIEPQHVDSLFSHSTFVGIIQIEAGFFQPYRGSIYKARVVESLKGEQSGYIYVGIYSGYKVGGKYFAFLCDTGNSVFNVWSTEAPFTGCEADYMSQTTFHWVDENGNPVYEVDQPLPPPLPFPNTLAHEAVLFSAMQAGGGMMEIDYSLKWDGEAVRVAERLVLLPESLSKDPQGRDVDLIYDVVTVPLLEVKEYLRQLYSGARSR